MTPPRSASDFLAAHGWGGAEIRPLAGDASFRRYFRVHRGAETAVLLAVAALWHAGWLPWWTAG